MKPSFITLCLALVLAAAACAAEDFTGTREIRLTHGELGNPKAKTVVIKDQAKIDQLVGTIKLEKKVPCACDHIDWAVFVKDKEEIKVSLCDSIAVTPPRRSGRYLECSSAAAGR